MPGKALHSRLRDLRPVHLLLGRCLVVRMSLFNPVVYLISGFRWSFYGLADVSIGISLGMTLAFLLVSLAIVAWIFKTGARLKA